MKAVYIDEIGQIVGCDNYQLNRDNPAPAQRLPTVPDTYQCLSCGVFFSSHPGEAVCRSCGHPYARKVD